jgi:nicotinamide-nucleotide amidase
LSSASTPHLELICVGTELLTGKTNTHLVYLGQKLPDAGLQISHEHSIGDDERVMEQTFREVWKRSDIVITSGGLGPTFDDITRDVWSKVLGRPLILYPRIVNDIRLKFKKRGLTMPPHNERQGYLLQGGKFIPNAKGTAPGQIFESKNKMLFLLPGPPRELYPMIEKAVIPHIKRKYSNLHLLAKSFHLVGVPESRIDQMIRPFVLKYQKLRGCTVVHGILASQSIITVKFSISGKKKQAVSQVKKELEREARKILSGMIFGEDGITLEQVINNLLRKKRKTMAVAESCTGGLISKLITDVPGASDIFVEGITTYQNQSKIRRLGVRPETLKKYGAVSEQTALEMARGLKTKTKAHYTLSVTGVAGPDGGSAAKPVGLVYIGCASSKRITVKKFQFTGDRSWIRHRSALMALDLLRQELLAT